MCRYHRNFKEIFETLAVHWYTAIIYLDVIEHGYKLPSILRLDTKHFSNKKSSLVHVHFIKGAIHEFTQSGRVASCSESYMIVNPLSVSVQAQG